MTLNTRIIERAIPREPSYQIDLKASGPHLRHDLIECHVGIHAQNPDLKLGTILSEFVKKLGEHVGKVFGVLFRCPVVEVGIAYCELLPFVSATADFEVPHLQLDNHYSAPSRFVLTVLSERTIIKFVKHQETDASNDGSAA